MGVWASQLRRGLVELCVLATLHDREAYGYEIVESLNSRARLEVGESTIYPILARLRKEERVTQRSVPSSQGPSRRYFKLTAAGKTLYKQMLEEWKSLNASVHRLIQNGDSP